MRICSDPTSFEERLGQLKLDLMSRKYPVKVIDEAFNRVRSKSRKQALQKVTKIELSKTLDQINSISRVQSVGKKWLVDNSDTAIAT